MITPFRIILAFLGKNAAAKDFLRDYLKGHVHPRFLTNVDISDAASGPYMWAVSTLDTEIDRQRFEDTIMLALAGMKWTDLDKPVKELRKIFRTEGGKTSLPKRGMGNDLAGDLSEELRKTLKISPDEADELVDPVGSPGEHTMDMKVILRMRNFVFEWLKRRFRQLTGDWIKYMKAKRREELPVKRIPKEEGGSGRDVEFSEDIFGRGDLKSDEELANEAVKQQGLEKKTYLKTLKFISSMNTPELFKAILHYRIMGLGGGKSYKEIGEPFDMTANRVQEKEKELIKKLKDLFGADVDTPKEVKEEVKEGEPEKKSPKQEKKETLSEGMELLKNKSDRDKFLSYFFEHKRMKPDTTTGQSIKLLAEGKSPEEVAKELNTSKTNVQRYKNRDLVPMLQEWVEEEMRTACNRIKTALLVMNGAPLWFIRQAVTKRVPYKPSGEEKGETPEAASAAHQKIVEQRLRRVLVTIHFSAPMDWLDIQKEMKKKDKPLASEEGRDLVNKAQEDFKFLKYNVVFDERWTFGRKDQTVNYTYEQDLSPEGKFVGSPKSSMRVNGKRVQDDDPVKKILDDYVEDLKTKHGLWVGGKKFKRGVFPSQIQYVNEAKNTTLTPAQTFKLYPPVISKDDPVHKEVREEQKQLEFRKVLGPSISRDWVALERKTKSTISRIKALLSEEKKKSKPNPDKIKKYEDWIEKLKEGLQEEKTKELKQELEESAKFLESEEEYWEWRDLEDEVDKISERLVSIMDKEKEEKTPDKEKIDKANKLETDMKKELSDKKKEALKKTLDEAKKFVSGDSQQRTAMERYAQGIGEPISEGAKEFVNLAQKYDKAYKELGGKDVALSNLTSWKGPGDVVAVAATVSKLLEEVLKRKLAQIKKDRGPTKGMSREEVQEARSEDEKAAMKAQMEVEKDRKRFPELYRAYVTDLKNRINNVAEKGKSAQERIKKLEEEKKKPGASIIKIMDEIKKAKEEAKVYESITNRIRNFDWTLDSKRLGDVVEKGEKHLEAVPDMTEFKQPSMNVVEVRKYDSLKGYVQNLMDGFEGIADKLDDAPVKAISSKEHIAKYEAQAKAFIDDAEKIAEEIHSISEDKKKLPPEEQEQINELKKKESEFRKEAQRMLKWTGHLKEIQAVFPARVAWRALTYFSELYNLLSSYIWFRGAQPARKAYEIIAVDEDEGPSKTERIKDNAANAIRGLSRYDVMSSSAIKKDVQTAKNLLNKFFTELGVGRHASDYSEYLTVDEYNTRYAAKRDKKPRKKYRVQDVAPKPEEKQEKGKEEKSQEKLRELKKTQLPGPMLQRANDLIKSLGSEKLVEEIGKNLQSEAKEDLEDLKGALVDYQSDRMTIDEIKDKAKDWGISVSQMQNILKTMEDDFVAEAFNTFENEWRDRIDTEKDRAYEEKKEQSKRKGPPQRGGPFMLRPAEEYEEIPRLLSRAGIETGEEPKEEKKEEPTKKTPRSVSKAIETAWKRYFTPEQVKKLIEGQKYGGKFRDSIRLFYESELDKWGFGGTDKSKARTRPKQPKTPPPAITREVMQKFLKQWIKDKPAGQIVTDWLDLLLTKLKRAQKEGKTYDEATLVHAVVNHLKMLKTLIVSLDVGPSGLYERRVESPSRMNVKPVLAVSPGGAPDISFDSKEEAIALWDKIAEIYKRINRYIKPDDIITVPENPSKANLKKFLGDMPRGLVEWYEDIETGKTASEWEDIRKDMGIGSNELSFNVVRKFTASQESETPMTLEDEFDLIRR